MHTIIKSQECYKQLKFRQLLRHISVHAGTIIRELFGVGAIVGILIVYNIPVILKLCA